MCCIMFPLFTQLKLQPNVNEKQKATNNSAVSDTQLSLFEVQLVMSPQL